MSAQGLCAYRYQHSMYQSKPDPLSTTGRNLLEPFRRTLVVGIVNLSQTEMVRIPGSRWERVQTAD
jgi:hypothetical protein